MSGALLLLAHSLKRMRWLVLTMGILLGAFQLLLTAYAGSIQNSGGFEQLSSLIPPFARELMGPSLTALMSFAGNVCFGYFHPIVMGSLVGLSIAIGTTPVSEVDSGFIDLILSRPLARHWVITRSFTAACLAITAVLGLMLLGTWTGLTTIAPKGVPWPSARLIRSLAINLGLLMLSWSAVALAIGAASRRRGVAGACASVLALAAFLIDYIGRLWRPLESVAWLSPFRYYAPFDLVVGGPLPLKNIVVLGSIAVAGFVAAQVLFSRRDLSH